ERKRGQRRDACFADRKASPLCVTWRPWHRERSVSRTLDRLWAASSAFPNGSRSTRDASTNSRRARAATSGFTSTSNARAAQIPRGGPAPAGFLPSPRLPPTALDVFLRPAGIKHAFNYGLERVRFITPVKAGARVRNRIGLLSVEERGAERLLLRTDNKIEIEAEEKPAMLAVALVLVERGNANGR